MPFEGKFYYEWLDDGINMRLLNDLIYTTKQGFRIVIPTGEETDGASIPRFLWSSQGSPFTGKYRKAAVVHDYLYRKGYNKKPLTTRKQADNIFYEAMIECGCTQYDSFKKYWAVRLFGPRW